MSIIQEALNKAQNIKTEASPETKSEANQPVSKPSLTAIFNLKPRDLNKLAIILGAVIIAISLAALSLNILRPKNKHKSNDYLESTLEVVQPPVQPAMANENYADKTNSLPSAAEPTTSKPQVPRLVLSGIFYSDDGSSYAIINDKIVKESETIKGAKVIKITSHSVNLTFNDLELVLKLK